MNKNVLVIGGAGYIGSSCVNELVNKGYGVVVLDNLSTGQIDRVNNKAKTIDGDILDITALENVFKDLFCLSGLCCYFFKHTKKRCLFFFLPQGYLRI